MDTLSIIALILYIIAGIIISLWMFNTNDVKVMLAFPSRFERIIARVATIFLWLPGLIIAIIYIIASELVK